MLDHLPEARMTTTEQPSTSATWDPTDHPPKDAFLAAFESSKAPFSPLIRSFAPHRVKFCIGLFQLMFPVDERAQSGKEVLKVNCRLAIKD